MRSNVKTSKIMKNELKERYEIERNKKNIKKHVCRVSN